MIEDFGLVVRENQNGDRFMVYSTRLQIGDVVAFSEIERGEAERNPDGIAQARSKRVLEMIEAIKLAKR